MPRTALALILAFAAAGPAAAQRPATSVTVTVTGLRSDDGEVRCALFRDARGFPRQPEAAALRARADASGKVATCVFPAVPTGSAAISAVHDANANGKLDMRLGFIPREGVGWSNNPRAVMAPPSFEQAKVEVGTTPLALTVRLNHR